MQDTSISTAQEAGGEISFRDRVFQEVLHLLGQGEMSKVDFKREPTDIAKLAKEIAAIANTDDPQATYYQDSDLRDFGFVIVGAVNGDITGYDDWREHNCPPEEEEKVKDCLIQRLQNYIYPLPNLGLYRFEREGKPFWVILIYPSYEQPHVMLKDGPDVQKHAVYVRKVSTSQLAGAEDYARFLRKAVKGAVEPLESELADLKRRFEALEGSWSILQKLLMQKGLESLFAGEAPSSAEIQGGLSHLALSPGGSLEEVARSMRLFKMDPVEEALFREVARLREGLTNLPWHLSGDPGEWWQVLKQVEELTQPLLRGLGELIVADREDKYALLVQRALESLGRAAIPPYFVTSWSSSAEALRLYPLLLSVHHLGMLAHFHRRAAYLKLILDLAFQTRVEQNPRNVLPWLRDYFYTHTYAFFEAKYASWCDPLGWHLYNLLFVDPALTWIHLPPAVREEAAQYASPSSPSGALAIYMEGEFVLGLLALKPQLGAQRVRPLYGLYAYVLPLERIKSIESLLARPPEHLCQILDLSGKTFEPYLRALAENLGGSAKCFSGASYFKGLADQAASGTLGSCPPTPPTP